MAVTPMMRQYLEVKDQYRDAILFFRLGDFYEMFYDDAKLVSRELELTLTGKDCGEPERAPMCGIPFHSAESYIGRLVKRGYKVVICEQVEDPALAKGLVKREVTRIITPGTVIENNFLDEGQNNYLCAVYMSDGCAGVCFADASTGDISATRIEGDQFTRRLINEIATYAPRELLLSCPKETCPVLTEYLTGQLHCVINDSLPGSFDRTAAGPLISRCFGRIPEAIGPEDGCILSAAGALIAYINDTQKTDISYFKELNVYHDGQYLDMDVNTRRNLELCETLRTKEKKGTLLWVLDRTRTSMGARLLRKWVELPLRNVNAIIRRQGAVKELSESFMLREEIADAMRSVLDIERLMTKIVYGTASAKDLRAVANTLKLIPHLRELIAESQSPELRDLYANLDPLEDIASLIDSAIVEDPPFIIREGGMIRPGYSREVDELNDIIHNGKGYIERIEAEEREKTGIKNLKIGYNRVFGYYIEISKSFLAQAPDRYIRKQTLTNCERFITQELKDMEATILGASDRIAALEYELFCQIRDRVSSQAERIQITAGKLALLDVYNALADVAVRNNFVCPDVEYGDTIKIKEGRHPVVEQFVADHYFVPNDTVLDTNYNRLMLITGPNMAGKSTYMRQVALITVMAQIGSFVPAREARIGICDKIFTRVGASDDLASGQSTFMLEMNEVAYILKNATKRSLIIYDEIGRGTSTFDGMSIARAVAEYTLGKKIGAKTLFATHYHELTELEGEFPGVVNYNIAAKKKGDDITFLRKIVRGSADDSYGIEVAKLAGVPNEVIRRAKEVLKLLEAKSSAAAAAEPPKEEESNQNLTFEDFKASEIVARIEQINLDGLTPIEALNILYELKKLAR